MASEMNSARNRTRIVAAVVSSGKKASSAE